MCSMAIINLSSALSYYIPKVLVLPLPSIDTHEILHPVLFFFFVCSHEIERKKLFWR